MMKKIMRQDSGMTLVELMVSLVVSSFVIAGVYGVYTIQQRSYKVQDQVAEMQQRLRSAMDFLARDIRIAGSNPASEAACGKNNKITTLNHDEMVFNACNFEDKDNTGEADTTNYRITVKYYIDEKRLRLKRHDLSKGEPTFMPIAYDVDAFYLEYFDKDGKSTTSGNDVRSVRVSILIRSTYPDEQYKDNIIYTMDKAGAVFWPPDKKPTEDNYHRRQLTNTIYLRNMAQQ